MKSHGLQMEGPFIQDIIAVDSLSDRYVRTLHRKDFHDSRLSSRLAATAMDSIVVLPPGVSSIMLQEGKVSAALTEVSGLEVGRKNNIHEIRFGQLFLSPENGTDITELVAVKYSDSLSKIIREFTASYYLNTNFGERVTFEPIGFVKKPNKFGYVTRYEHGVTTLDNTLWYPSNEPQSKREYAIIKAAEWIAYLHICDVSHGDSQAKNIAIDSVGNPRYVDLETMKNVESEVWKKYSFLEDISLFFGVGCNIRPNLNKDEMALFIDRYREMVDAENTDCPSGSEIKKLIIQGLEDTLGAVGE